MIRALALALASLLALAACGDDAPDPDPCFTAGGTGLDRDACLLPWPSSAFLVPDASTRTKFRVQLPAALMPVNNHGVSVDPTPWNSWDGFSPMTTLFVQFASQLDPAPLPTWHDPARSLAGDSPTVIVDVDTGERVAHFDEIETAPDVAAGHTELYLRPAARLAEGHHYAVGIRDLVNLDGTAAAVGNEFRELRDRTPGVLASRRAAYEQDVFAPLAAAGVDRATLLLAWDFRTASGETAWSDLVTMRDRAVAAVGPNGLGCTITNVIEDAADTVIFRRIDGTITVPSFLDASLRIARDPSGRPIAPATVEAPFTAIVPRTAVAAGGPAPLWVYGHGLFSDRTEVDRRSGGGALDFGPATASAGAAIVVATDYTGLTLADQGDAAAAFLELSTFPQIIDRLRQGIVATLVLPRTFAGACAALPELAGQPAIATAGWGYFGNSMGGTLGQTIAALSPDVHRFAIGVGGMDFAVMMPRTHRWPQLEAFFQIGYPSRLDRDLLLVMSQNVWDLAESSTFGPHVLADPLPNSTAAEMVFHVGLYDCDTTNIASAIAERTLGDPAPPGSAYVVYDLGAAPLPDDTLPPPVEDGVHECVRRDPRAQQQIAQFLQAGGSVVDVCGGACGPIASSPACLALFATP